MATFKIAYRDGTEENLTGDKLTIGEKNISILDADSSILAYRPLHDIKSIDKVPNA